MARLPADHPDRPGLANREAELLAAHAAGWIAFHEPHAPGVWAVPGAWDRGFPRHLSLFAQECLDKLERFLAHEPVSGVTLALNLDYARPDVDDLAWVERLAASRRLTLVTKIDGGDSGFGPDRFAVLVGSPHLTQLRDIDLFEDTVGLPGVRALCASPAAGRLTRLCLNGAIEVNADDETPDAVAAVRELAGCPGLAGLEYLGLYYNGLREASVRALLASPHLSRSLDLEFEENGWEPPAELATALAARFRPPNR